MLKRFVLYIYEEGIYQDYDTYDEALSAAKDYIHDQGCDEGYPEDWRQDGAVQILEVVAGSQVTVTDKKSNYVTPGMTEEEQEEALEEYAGGCDFDECWDIQMVKTLGGGE
jgi:hypothetical protein